MKSNNKTIHLLLVDDEEEFLWATSRTLGRRGFQVTVAPNGVSALEQVAHDAFDVVVLDVKMPDIDGIEVFRQIHEKMPATPIILLTGHSSISDAFQTSKEGIADYLSKPIDIDVLASRITQAVDKARQRQKKSKPTGVLSELNQSINVMIVDDEVELLDSLQRVFTKRKIKTVTAESGLKALEMLEEELVDVMVLDVKMPGMDGLEVLRIVKKKFPNIQVILLSGHPSVEAALEGIKLGASEYLKKPPEIDLLVATIRNLHRQRQEVLEEQQRKLIEDILKRYPD